MPQFDINPLSRFAGSSAAIKRPKEIAHFSYDSSHTFHLDARSLRYYYPPQHLPLNLSAGFETFKKLDDTPDDHLDALLKTIMDLEMRTGERCEADVVTWRGMMTKIMAAPFDNFNSFEMNATCFQCAIRGRYAATSWADSHIWAKGTIYIEEDHAYKLASWEEQRTQTPKQGAMSQDLMSYWGYKFETLSLIPDIWDATTRDYIEGREHMVVDNYAQYCSVARTGIGGMSLVIGGEVDAVWDFKPEDSSLPINWVELKTAEEIGSDRDALKFERKLLKFWVQSFLLGVAKIIVGFRSKDGYLTRIQEIETRTIPGNVRRKGKGSWDGNTCINFAAAFLDFLRRTITGEGVWKISKRQGSSTIDVSKVEDSGTGDILAQEFLDWRQRQTDLAIVNGTS